MISIFQQIYGGNLSAWAGWLIVLACVALLVAFCYKFIYWLVEHRTSAENRQRWERLNLMLMASHVNIWMYDVKKQQLIGNVANNDNQVLMTPQEFAARYGQGVFDQLKESVHRILKGELEEETTEITVTNNGQTFDYLVIIKPLHRDAEGRPTTLIITRKDMTEQRQRQHQTKQLLLQCKSIFDSAMSDMMYFDADGVLTDINQKARETFHLDPEAIKRREVTIHGLLGIDRQQTESHDYFYATLNIGQMYYELQLVSIHNDKGDTLGIYATGRDITEQVNAYQQQQNAINTIAAATKETERYVSNINNVLNVGGVRLADYEPDKHTLTLYKGIGQIQLQLTPARYMTLVSKHSMQAALRVLHRLDNKAKESQSLEVETTLRHAGQPLVLQFNFIPTYDQQGQVVSYFGMCRDISDIKATEAELEQQTAKAQKIEAEKNDFLRNMSYEIRTPLNTVVGFAELFEKPHDSDDESVYISQIKDSSEFLLHLINDILFLSRLDAHMTEINRRPTDFASVFENYCQIAWKDYQREGVRYVVENNFEQLEVNIDSSNVAYIISQVVQNAAIHTKSGIVRTHYDYVGGKLVIVIDDTGEGIAKQILGTIYERFSANSKGTGLGLPICKELLTQMGGHIDISSTPGQGTTVWITVPCEATAIVKKKDIEV